MARPPLRRVLPAERDSLDAARVPLRAPAGASSVRASSGVRGLAGGALVSRGADRDLPPAPPDARGPRPARETRPDHDLPLADPPGHAREPAPSQALRVPEGPADRARAARSVRHPAGGAIPSHV